MAIPIYERQSGTAPLPGARVQSFASGESAGPDIARLGAAVQAKVDEFEDAQTLEALNNFQRDVDRYHLDAEKGVYNTKQGKDAFGVADSSDAYIDNRAFEFASKLPSARAAQNFNRMARQVRERQYASNLKWESAQLEAYKTGEAKANIENSLNAIFALPEDNETAEISRQNIYQALELLNRGAGPEAFQAAKREADEQIADGRFSALFSSDPNAAISYYAEHRDEMSVNGRAKAQETMKIYEVQGITDEIVRKFGIDDDTAVYQWIRDNYGGEKEERVVSAYRSRVSELTAARANREESLYRQQTNNFRELYKQYVGNGAPVPEEVLSNLLMTDKISPSHFESLMTDNRQLRERTSVINRLKATNPDWNMFDLDTQDKLIMRGMNVTEDDHQAALAVIYSGIMGGQLNTDNVELVLGDYSTSGLITRNGKAQLTATVKNFPKEQRAFVEDRNKSIRAAFVNISDGRGDWTDSELAREAQYIFDQKIGLLEPLSPTYRDDVNKARDEAIAEAIEISGKVSEKKLRKIDDIRERFWKENEKTIEYQFNFPSTAPRAMKTLHEENGELISKLAEKNGVSEALLYAVIQTESGGNKKAKSNAGAQGLMQLMPGTAKDLGVTDANNAAQNLTGGSKYLGQLLRRYNGNLTYALWAYNGGMGRVDKFLAGNGELPEETVKYPGKVLKNMSLYNSPPLEKTLSDLWGEWQNE
jgi:hypothetical protein